VLHLGRLSLAQNSLEDSPKGNALAYFISASATKKKTVLYRRPLAEEFPRQNASQAVDIFRERDVSLKRDVVVLKRTCHKLQFVHTFRDVPPGKYTVQVSISIKITTVMYECL
jgi:hypothetical protein